MNVWGVENNFSNVVHERTVDIYKHFHAVTIFQHPNSVHIMGQSIYATQVVKNTPLKCG